MSRGNVVRLSLGRRLVNLLPVARRSNAFHKWRRRQNMGRWSWVRISRPPWKRFLKKSEFPHVENLTNHSPWVLRGENLGVGTYGPIRRPRIPLFKGRESVIRLSFGRRLVNLLPVAQWTNAFTNGVVDRAKMWWYGLGRPVITSEIGNWSVFVLLGWLFVFGIIVKRDGREPHRQMPSRLWE